jgi:hypothetical protein
MSMKQPKMKAPKPDPALKEAQEAQKRAEQERISELKRSQLDRTRNRLGGAGVRSLIAGSGAAGFGRNFF